MKMFSLMELTLHLGVCSYISGYKNRFQNFIKHLREMGDEVHILLSFGRVEILGAAD
jgi:hypothetical protein